jgi:hypothetical protein
VIPEDVADDWTNDTRGYGWTQNTDFLKDKRQLLKVMLADPDLKLARVDNGKLEFNTARVWDYSHKCDALLEKLLLFVYLTPGQTPRIAELIDAKLLNSTRPRNIFRDRDGIWFVTRRVKTETQTRKETFIPIKCHPLLTKFLETYLLLVRPVLAELMHFLKGEEAYHIYSEYMWVAKGGRMTADDAYPMVKNFMADYCDVRAGSHDYRQIAVEIGRVFLGSGFEVDQEQLDLVASQANHSAKMAQFKYAAEIGHLPSMSSDLLLRYGRISEAWWEVTGFKPNTPPMLPHRWRALNRMAALGTNSSTAPLHDPTAGQAVLDSAHLLKDLTATLTHEIQQVKLGLRDDVRSAIADALAEVQLGRNSTRASGVVSPPLRVPHNVRDVADDMYGPPPPPPPAQVVPDVRDDWDDMYASPPPIASSSLPLGMSSQLSYRPTAQSREYLEQLLADHFRDIDEPKFKSEAQMQAVELSLAREENFVAVLPTGSGKSLVFTLPPFNEHNLHTYVIIPNKTLLEDQKQKAQKLGIATHTWSTGRQTLPRDAQVVFLALESATHVKFNQLVPRSYSIHLF